MLPDITFAETPLRYAVLPEYVYVITPELNTACSPEIMEETVPDKLIREAIW